MSTLPTQPDNVPPVYSPSQPLPPQNPPVAAPVPPVSNPESVPPRSSGGKKLLMLVGSILLVLVGIGLGWFLKDSITVPTEPMQEVVEVNTQPLVIGGIVPLTGDSASYGVAIQQAGFLAQREINAAGGIAGRPVEIIWENGRCEGEDARLAAEKLLNENQVEMLMAGLCSSEFLNSAPLAQAKRVISMSPSATSPKISTLGSYIFRTVPSDSLAGRVAAEYSSSKWNAKTAAVVAENKDYPIALSDVFTQEFQKAGGEVLYSGVFESGTTVFTDYAAQVKEANVDVVYILPQSSTPGVLLVKALKEAGVTSKILTAEVLLIRDAVAESGQILEGVTGIELLVDETRPQTRKFLDLYKQEYNLDPTYPGFMSGMYDIVYLYKDAYEAVGADPDQISEYFYNLADWQGAVGVLNFDRNGDPTMSYSIRLLTGGEAQQVDVYTPTTQ